MTKHVRTDTGKGIVRPTRNEKRGREGRIAVFKLTGFAATMAVISDVLRWSVEDDFPGLWKVDVGKRAPVAPEDRGRRRSARNFTEALALADEILRRGEAFHRLDRMMPSRLRPRPRHTHFERWRVGVPQRGATYDEIHHWERNQNHV